MIEKIFTIRTIDDAFLYSYVAYERSCYIVAYKEISFTHSAIFFIHIHTSYPFFLSYTNFKQSKNQAPDNSRLLWIASKEVIFAFECTIWEVK